MKALLYIALIIIVIVIWRLLAKKYRLKQLAKAKAAREKQINDIQERIFVAFEDDEISETHAVYLKQRMFIPQFEDHFQKLKAMHATYKERLNKYGQEVADKMEKEQYWIGMTAEQLIEMKGIPSQVEKTMVKDTVKETYIYGSKSKGDCIYFENGIATKIIDR